MGRALPRLAADTPHRSRPATLPPASSGWGQVILLPIDLRSRSFRAQEDASDMSSNETGQQTLELITGIQAQTARATEPGEALASPTLHIDLLAELTADAFDASAIAERLLSRARRN